MRNLALSRCEGKDRYIELEFLELSSGSCVVSKLIFFGLVSQRKTFSTLVNEITPSCAILSLNSNSADFRLARFTERNLRSRNDHRWRKKPAIAKCPVPRLSRYTYHGHIDMVMR